jgi:SecD/SecF fusion protein
MQNKGAIIILAIALAVVSVYQLSFSVATWTVKRAASEYANGDLVKETQYLDSIASLSKEEWSYLGNTFKECQKKEINLGLDLKGGMNVTLEVAVEDVLRALSNYSQDKSFNDAIALAKEMQKSSQADFLTLFGRAFEQVSPNGQLSAIFGTVELRDRINFNTTNEQVLDVLNDEVDIAIENAFNILRTRIDRFGVVQPNITQLSTKGRILIELPGQKDPQRVRELLQGTANLEFWETYENSEIINYLMVANETLAQIQDDLNTDASSAVENTEETVADTTSADDALLSLIDSTATSTSDESLSRDEFNLQNPLFAVLSPNVSSTGEPMASSMVGLALAKDTAKVNSYLHMNQIRSIFPRDVNFMWSQNPYPYAEGEAFYELHAIKVNTRDGRAPLDGSAVTSARPSTNTISGSITVDMSMNAEGAKTWARMTRENVGRCIAVVLDGYVRSYPRVVSEITGGNTEISGDFTLEEATDLANILKSGKMPAPAKIVSDTIVGPTLGQEAIHSGMVSFMISFVIILLFMVFYYSKSAGTIADIALMSNVFLTFGVLASLGAVLTLPGIAGIVLTLGMSVDANVLIFERIREEIRSGKGMKLAISDGYKNAYSAIIDSNITTLLTGAVLYTFGTGPIKGFATTLVIGILTSLFAAIFITRLIYEGKLKNNKDLIFSIPVTANFLKNVNIDFIKFRKYAYLISASIIILGIGSLFVRGLNLGLDFKGGRTYVVRFDETVSTSDVAASLENVFGERPQVVTFGEDNQVKITTTYKIDDSGVDSEVEDLLYQGLKPMIGDNVSEDQFLSDYRVSSETIGPTIAADIKIKAVWSVGFALIIIFLYIFIRFRNWQYGLGAVASLSHDAFVIIAIFSLLYGILPFSMEIDQSFIAAILTTIGYSVNDTVIIFDRIREYRPIYRKRPLKEVLNKAINDTLSRTIITSLTTFLTVFVIFLFGGATIQGFVFALMMGMISGVYSTVFVATALVYDTTKHEHDEEKAIDTKKGLK